MCRYIFLTLFCIGIFLSHGDAQHKNRLFHKQSTHFTHADSLRGSIGKGRSWWNLIHYDLNVKIDPIKKSISGKNTISFKVLSVGKYMQIDLQSPLLMDSILIKNEKVSFTRDGDAYFIPVKSMIINSTKRVTCYYHGIPREAINPPWDGGFTWTKDNQKKAWVGLSCQGLGASVWFPCKDHQYDEPDSVNLSVTVPLGLIDVSGGRLIGRKVNADSTETFSWFTSSPINNYDISINIGDYEHFMEPYSGLGGPLTLDFWVLKEDLIQAQSQFSQVKTMLSCFEFWFGPYPFYKDGYKLIETPYLGMEHQSAIAYGNHFKNGYLGQDLSRTGLGLDWDYIIVHESAHEWFGNNITSRDIADMWVHESFATYAESLFVECQKGREAGEHYVRGLRKEVANDSPIMGPFNVNHEGSRDMYFKGANMLNTVRKIIGNDTIWKNTLRLLGKTYYHKTVTGKEIRSAISKASGKNLDKVFQQYLEFKDLPKLEYKINQNRLSFRWKCQVQDFKMPLIIKLNSGWKEIFPSSEWATLPEEFGNKGLEVDPNFYIDLQKVE